MKFVNTQYFREAAIAFEKNGGVYTKAPYKTREWWEFWREQERRCKEGHTVGDMSITGKHYWYLNFSRIQRTIGTGKVQRKVEEFPRFWEIDYNWFWYKEIAWWGATEEQILALNLSKNPKMKDVIREDGTTYRGVEGGHHLSCLKTRRAGFSFKEASEGTYIFNFVPKAICYYYAGLERFLAGTDGILTKAQVDLEWLNVHTQDFWRKNRMKHGTVLHQKASYIDLDDKAEKGYFSQIVGVVLDDPDKARGGDGYKVTFEEGGSFPNLKEALDKIVPALTEGGVMTGQATVFGTGGEEGPDIEGLDEIFNDPLAYNMLAFENDWEDFESTECGVFVPCYMANTSYMDVDGNVDKEKAIEFDDQQREIAKKAKDPKKLDRRCAEYPRTPSEALIRLTFNNFPVNEAKAQKVRVLKDLAIQGKIQHGQLVREQIGIKFYPQSRDEARPVEHYPHKKKDDLEGCITIFEHPERNSDGSIDPDLYIINVDPYYDDEAQDVTSLGSIYVTKRGYNVNATHVMDVAWSNARPKSLTTFHTRILLLAEYYNAKVQCEVGGGGKGVYDFFRVQKKLNYLEMNPVNIDLKEVKKENNRTYLMTISTDDKQNGLTYYQDWLSSPVCIDAYGNTLMNIHFVHDVGLLEEIIKFKSDKNADRISAQIVKQFMLKEKALIATKRNKKKRKSLADRNLFSEDSNPSNLGRIVNGEMIF